MRNDRNSVKPEGWGLLRMLKVRRGVERGLNLDSKKVEREIVYLLSDRNKGKRQKKKKIGYRRG